MFAIKMSRAPIHWPKSEQPDPLRIIAKISWYDRLWRTGVI